jgi:hypothetical protein
MKARRATETQVPPGRSASVTTSDSGAHLADAYMRVAISGSHATGKTSLIEEFLSRHHGFAHEPEPYVTLEEAYGESFAQEPTVEDFRRQVEFSIQTLRQYQPADCVIFERSPVDFLAYIVALLETGSSHRRDAGLDETIALVKSALPCLDVIVFLPLDHAGNMEVPDIENPALRGDVDDLLHDIFLENQFDLFGADGPIIVEARGTMSERLKTVENALGRASG